LEDSVSLENVIDRLAWATEHIKLKTLDAYFLLRLSELHEQYIYFIARNYGSLRNEHLEALEKLEYEKDRTMRQAIMDIIDEFSYIGCCRSPIAVNYYEDDSKSDEV
jgi:hypothetical protein